MTHITTVQSKKMLLRKLFKILLKSITHITEGSEWDAGADAAARPRVGAPPGLPRPRRFPGNQASKNKRYPDLACLYPKLQAQFSSWVGPQLYTPDPTPCLFPG